MLANDRLKVKGVVAVLVRRLVRIVLRMVFVALVVALARAVLGRLAGEPGVSPGPGANGSAPRVPMSLDRWPAVPQAPSRSEA